MRVIRRIFKDLNRGKIFRLFPIGDIHIGAKACDEVLLEHIVKAVAADKDAYWIGMGDYCDFINRSDRRFDPGSLAPWLSQYEPDLARAQVDHFLKIIKPIAPKCLGLVKGNHEDFILKRYERDVYSDIVNAIKDYGKFDPGEKLMIGYNGWLVLVFNRSKKSNTGAQTIKIRLHHGFGGGSLAGGKALNMERFLWSNDCDLALMGHTHEAGMPIRREMTSVAGKRTVRKTKIGAWTGTFLGSYAEDTDTYAEIKGYFPRPVGGVEVVLRPGAAKPEDRIRVITGI